MVNFLRLFLIAFAAWFKPKGKLLDLSVVALCVWPTDLDLNLHMNNGRYLSLMDLGRVDLMFRSGFSIWIRGGRQPLVATSFCRHFKPLRFLQSFELHSRILGWDEKWFYIEHRFLSRGKLHALGAVKALVADPDRLVPTRELFGLKEGEALPPSPALPDWVKAWLESEAAAIAQLKAEAGRPS
jgi:acyl-CoA thioesterase FadM